MPRERDDKQRPEITPPPFYDEEPVREKHYPGRCICAYCGKTGVADDLCAPMLIN